jgi:hypothetical protein
MSQVEIVERSSGWWVVGDEGYAEGPYLEYGDAERASECPECGNLLDGDGFCGMCSRADADFVRRAYGYD